MTSQIKHYVGLLFTDSLIGNCEQGRKLVSQRTNTNLTLFRKCDATLSLRNRANCSKARLTLSHLNAIFYLRMCFSLLPLKHSTSSFNTSLILNQLLKIVAWLTDGTNESVRSSEELLATGKSVFAVRGFSSRVRYFHGNLKIDKQVEHCRAVPCIKTPEKEESSDFCINLSKPPSLCN